MLVLCAREIQPPAVGFAGRLLRAPLPDAPLDRLELGRALAASRRVADASRAGQAVLVTCAMGRNRSALVAALAMLRLTRMSASDVVEQIRRNRAPECLTNPAFVKIVHWFAALPARR